MIDNALVHAKAWGPMYAIIVLLGGGGGIAAFTDSLPVTQAQFSEHEHTGLAERVDNIYKGQLRERLIRAYADRCNTTSPEALRYINSEINRLRAEYYKLTGLNFETPPCL